MNRLRIRRWRRLRHGVAYASAAALAASLLGVPATAKAADRTWATPQKDRPVSGTAARMTPLPDNSGGHAATKALPKPVWPAGGSATVTLPAATRTAAAADIAPVRAGSLPVFVGTAGSARSDRTRPVRVDLLDHAATERVGLQGLAVRLAAAADTGPVALSVDYGAFAGAYGGDWATRLRFVPLPECALSTPDKPECRPGDPIATRIDTAAKRLTADVDAGQPLYALLAGPSGPGGSYTASPLSQAATWQVSPQTGDFTWSYELDAPPALNGPAPQLGLGYSSGAVDGRIASSNNQPSWVGEGFDLSPGGFIERRYTPCADDGSAGSPKRGDLCFAYDNATMQLGGSATELIRDDATGVWRPRNDDGTRIEHLTGAVNDDADGEYWRVTTLDGTQYYFGRNRLPTWASGQPTTDSTWAVPVYGNNPGEPCYKATFADASCQQAWRWNLDYVVDPRRNAMAYFYKKEANYYARNLNTATGYTRGGYLAEIRYGLRDETPYAPAPAKVLFTVAERCLPSGTITCSDAQFVPANAGYWPDTPVDQNCKAGTSCTAQISPSFWTRLRLTGVTTQVLRGTQWADVDNWTLRQEFPASDSGTPALWLAGITHTGRVGGTAIAQPEVTFGRVQMPNRIDVQGDNIPPMVKFRVRSITSETGGVVSVNYSSQQCTATSLPAPDTNTQLCFPTFWQPDGATASVQDWFNKYVTNDVQEDDRIDGSVDGSTSYEYLGGAAWHYTDDDGLVKEKEKTWSQWRGFGQVKVREGAAGQPRAETDYVYLRGMDGDKLANGGTKSVTVPDSTGGPPIVDAPQLQGFTREEIERNGDSGAELSGKINDPWLRGPTATRTRDFGTVKGVAVSAYTVNIAKARTRVPLAGGGVRRTEMSSTFTPEGLPSQVDDAGDTAISGDEKCTRNTYVRTDATWMVAYPSQATTVAAACSAPLRTLAGDDIIADEKTAYDGQAAGVAPTKGLPTTVEELSAPGTYRTSTRNKYDIHGRIIEAYDSLNNKTSTTYTPATGGPVTRQVVTNALNQTETTDYDPAWGDETKVTDEGGKTTEFAYDALGRLSQVWLPGRSRSQSPSEEFGYVTRTDGPNVVSTKQLRNDGSAYNTSYQIFDALQRPRQTQTPAPDGGRVLSDVIYDARGLPVRKNEPYYYDAQPPSGELQIVPDSQVPNQDLIVYDGAERTVAEIFLSYGLEKWRTTTSYEGDRITVDPPTGETPTTDIVDAAGQTVELRQYKGDSPTGAYDATKYTYTADGELDTVTDPMGNARRYHYDLRGRLTSLEDPDAGTEQYAYDDEDRVISNTDARGRTITTNYDALDRVTSTYEGSTKLTEYVYDTVVAGNVTSATRYVDGNPYTTKVVEYDEADRPKKTQIVIPANETGLAGTYEFGSTYNIDGTIASSTDPAAGGLPKETVRYAYNDLGLPTTSTGLSSYVTETKYSKLAEPISQVYSTGAKRVVRTSSYEEGTRRLHEVITETDGTPQRVGDVSYKYDDAGNIVRISDAPPSQAADTQCFVYDYLRRLTEAWTPANSDCGAARSAAALGGPAKYWQSFSYDAVGNRTREVQHAVGGDTTRTYASPAAGTAQPHSLKSVASSGPQGTKTDSFAYDPAGNTTKRVVDGATQVLDWTAEGNVAKVTEGTKVTSYVYDADGTRLIRRDPTGTTLYLDGMELTLKPGIAVSALRYYDQDGDPVALRTSTGVQFLLGDHHDTDELSIDAETMAVTQRWFDPFGAARGPNAAGWIGDRSFVGGTADPSTGLIHLGAREYDPRTGRFISLDPVVDVNDPQQLHGYAYANNSPETYSDSDGMWFSCGWCKRQLEAARRAYQRWLAWKRWKARVEAARRLARKLAEEAKKAAQKAKQLARKVVRKAKAAARRAYVATKKKIQKSIRTFKHVVKRVSSSVKRAATKVAKAAKNSAKWVNKHVDWGKVWTVTKITLAVAAMFTCTICAVAAYATWAITAIDTVNSVRDGDYLGAAMGVIPGGALSKAGKTGAKLMIAGRGVRGMPKAEVEVADTVAHTMRDTRGMPEPDNPMGRPEPGKDTHSAKGKRGRSAAYIAFRIFDAVIGHHH